MKQSENYVKPETTC